MLTEVVVLPVPPLLLRTLSIKGRTRKPYQMITKKLIHRNQIMADGIRIQLT